MKERKGITLIALVVTICVMLILAGVGIYTGVSSVNTSKDSIAQTELGMVQHLVLETYSKYQVIGDERILVGEKQKYQQVKDTISELVDKIELKIEDYDCKENIEQEEYYYELTPENSKKIGIDNAKDTYIVNYKTGEVINKTRLKTSTNEPLYVYAIKNNN